MKEWRKAFYPVLLVTWAVILAVQLIQINRSASRLKLATDKIDALRGAFNENSRTVVGLVNETRDRSAELEFLQSLFKLLPESESFLRTQKVLLDDVQTLRSKIGNRLNGRLHLLVDTKTNKLFLKQGVRLLWEADCSVGRGGMLTDAKTGRKWEFVTPRGKFRILSKMENPTWIKPDWAFVEGGELPPPPGDPRREVQGELGAYVLNLGDGYLIHGTKNEAVLGHAVSHGCVRLGAENLKKLYEQTPVGTEVYIY